jgi:hypothetical protein
LQLLLCSDSAGRLANNAQGTGASEANRTNLCIQNRLCII